VPTHGNIYSGITQIRGELQLKNGSTISIINETNNTFKNWNFSS